MSHHIKGKDFLSDKYRILRIDSLEKQKEIGKGVELASRIGYNQALEDIKKLSEEVSLNKIVLSFNDEHARFALKKYTGKVLLDLGDTELAKDILEVLDNYKE